MTSKTYSKIIGLIGSNEITIITNTIPKKITTLTDNIECIDECLLQIYLYGKKMFTQHYIPLECVLSITESFDMENVDESLLEKCSDEITEE